MVLVVGCGGSSSNAETGDLGGKCYPNKTCNDNFVCDEESDICIKNSADASDSDTTDSSDSDNNPNSDTTNDDSSECNPNPCKDLKNSTGNCSTNFYTSIPTNFYSQYVCECKKGYVFDGASCIKNSSNLPLCNPESKTPCIDAETALIWSAKTPEKMGKVDTMDYCNNLNEGGYNDWRLPSYKVLGTLLVNCEPPYDSGDAPTLYANCQGGSKSDGSYSKFGEVVFLWSATSGGISFLNGCLNPYKEGDAYARCVRKDFPDSHEAKCLQGLPENAKWVTDTVTQTWDWSNMWSPTTEGKYGSNNENENGCFFKCDSDYYYDKGGYVYNGIDIYGKCINPCISEPCKGVEHSTEECVIDVDNKDYQCKCESNWEWKRDEHICLPSSGIPIDGVTWSSESQSKMSWEEALAYCDNLTEDGYSNWHLPTINELRNLIRNCENTATGGSCGVNDSCLYSDCQNDACKGCTENQNGKYSKLGDHDSFWSSSAPEYSDIRWGVNFSKASIFPQYQDSYSFYSNNVRCAR